MLLFINKKFAPDLFQAAHKYGNTIPAVIS